jgi:hypothetical protein
VRRVEEHYSLKTMMFFGQKIAKPSERETLYRPNVPCTTCPIRQSEQNRAMAIAFIAFDHERQWRHDGSVLARETRDGAVVQWNIYF